MTTATINGKPSLYLTITPPQPTQPSYPERIADLTTIASEMVEDSEPQTDADWLNDPETQAELNAWYDSLDTPEAQAEYDAWVTEQERASLETTESEAYEAHLEAQAEEYDLARLGDAYLEGINGHDLKWQAGIT